MVGPGTIISGKIHGSVISVGRDRRGRVGCAGIVLLPGVRIGKGAVVRRAILDKNVVVPDGALIGVDAPWTVSATRCPRSGVTVLGKGVRAY